MYLHAPSPEETAIVEGQKRALDRRLKTNFVLATGASTLIVNMEKRRLRIDRMADQKTEFEFVRFSSGPLTSPFFYLVPVERSFSHVPAPIVDP